MQKMVSSRGEAEGDDTIFLFPSVYLERVSKPQR
jgi:hypothetical protein